MESVFDPLKFYAEAMRAAFAAHDTGKMKELASKSELRETELRLQAELRATGLRLLKCQFAIALALAAIIARGFGWLGF